LLLPTVTGILGLWWQSRILTAATAIVGSFVFMLGFTYLLLVPIDARFARWLTPEHAQLDRFTVTTYFAATRSAGLCSPEAAVRY
jgi:hypothetical protein